MDWLSGAMGESKIPSAYQGAGQAGAAGGGGTGFLGNTWNSFANGPEAAHLQQLGQQLPQGVQLMGPSSTFQSTGGQIGTGLTNFMRGVGQGYLGMPSGMTPQGYSGAAGQFLGGQLQGGGGGGGQAQQDPMQQLLAMVAAMKRGGGGGGFRV